MRPHSMKPCQIGLQTRRPVFLGLLLSVLLIVALAIALLTRHTMYGPVHTTATLHSTFNTSKMVDRGNTLNLLDIAKFNTTLGCWHLRQDPVGLQASMHVSAEANFAPGARWEEVQKAVQLTQASNHGIHYVLVTNQLSMLHLLEETPTFNSVHYDVWYCPEVLYGTPIRIGNLYKGHKFAVSIDNWLPTFERRCLFATSKHQIVYVVQRNESHQLTGQDVSCTHYRAMGSADGILYGYIPDEVAQYMRFPRTYWGCENLALFVLRRAGIQLIDLCPTYAPVHVHKSGLRESGRLRVNHPENSVSSGQAHTMEKFCSLINEAK